MPEHISTKNISNSPFKNNPPPASDSSSSTDIPAIDIPAIDIPAIDIPAIDIPAMVAARREGGFSRTLHDIIIVTWRNLLIDFRNPASLIVSALFATSLLFVFTASFARVVNPEGGFSSYAQFLLPFAIVQGLLFNTVDIGGFFYTDLENGMDIRLRAMPIARLAAIGGRLLSSGARLLIQVVAIAIAGHLIGFRFQGSLWETLGFFLLPVVFTLSIALIGFYVAVGAKSAETVSAVLNPWILPFTFLSAGYVPVEGFPNWAQPFVTYNPISILAGAMRSMASGEPAMQNVLTILLWSLALCSLFGTLTVRAYQRKTL
ncbi:MAG: ABC transporter permease [Phormidesmis sp.]